MGTDRAYYEVEAAMTKKYPYSWFVPTEKELAEVDIEQLQDLLALTLDERLRRHEGARQLVLKLKEAGRKHYGFDPATVTQTANRAG